MNREEKPVSEPIGTDPICESGRRSVAGTRGLDDSTVRP